MEQPRIRDQVKDAVVGAIKDASKETVLEARSNAVIGYHVVNDCKVFGVSVWRRKEDGSVEQVDPATVEITIRPSEVPPGGSFPAHRISG